MERIVVGILPSIKIGSDDMVYHDCYSFVNLYSKKVLEAGGIPMGILLEDGKLDMDSLRVCDALLLPGGNCIKNPYYETVDYAVSKNVPLLGICMGMQAMGIYSSTGYDEDFVSSYSALKRKYGGALRRIEEPHFHNKCSITHDEEAVENARHCITIYNGSLLYDILKTNRASVVSLHNFTINELGSDFKVTARADDGITEAIEYDSPSHFILGVQFHPEASLDDNRIIKRLVLEGAKRR